MKKRLRKKLRLGEFQELGFELQFNFRDDIIGDAHYNLVWDFIEGAIEDNGLLAGGFGMVPADGFIVSEENRASVTEQQRQAVIDWLEADERITKWKAGPLVDAWHG